MKHIKNHIIRILTGWNAVETFGNPKGKTKDYIACHKNGVVTEQYYSNLSKRWFSCYGRVKEDNPVVFWIKLPKRPMFFKIDE